MPNLILIIFMMIGGVAVALQPSINARLAEKTGFFTSGHSLFCGWNLDLGCGFAGEWTGEFPTYF